MTILHLRETALRSKDCEITILLVVGASVWTPAGILAYPAYPIQSNPIH